MTLGKQKPFFFVRILYLLFFVSRTHNTNDCASLPVKAKSFRQTIPVDDETIETM